MLLLFTLQGEWRAHRETEPLHMYYTGFDQMTNLEIEEVFPEADGVPAGLNFKDLLDAADTAMLTKEDFESWLFHGIDRHRTFPKVRQNWSNLSKLKPVSSFLQSPGL